MKQYLKKQLKNRDKKLKYDFLPSMIEIIEKPANRMGEIIIYVILVMLVTAIIWASRTKLDIAVTAMGAAKPKDAIISLNAQSGGVIQDIKVQDGEYVQAGDIICTFDSETNETSLKEGTYNLEVLDIQKEVYEAVYEKLEAEDYSELEMDTEQYGDNQRFADAIIVEYDIFLDSLEQAWYTEAENMKSNELLNVLQNLNTIDAKIESVSADIETIKQELEKSVITAPQSGIYSKANELYTGKMVAAGDVLGYIMPEKQADMFTAYVSNEDISQITVGDVVRIRLAAFADTDYEYIDGRVTSIGNVVMQIENMGSVYPVEINLEQVPPDIKAGMEGSIDILVGTRTVMDYFLEPFRKGLRDSMKEK